jgi:hypothetical protein
MCEVQVKALTLLLKFCIILATQSFLFMVIPPSFHGINHQKPIAQGVWVHHQFEMPNFFNVNFLGMQHTKHKNN